MKVYEESLDPRAKIWQAPETATFAEILAVLLSHGTRQRNVKLLSQDIANLARDEASLFELDAAALTSIPGIGRSRAAVILAATELGRRRYNRTLDKREIFAPDQVARVLEHLLLGKPNEFFYLFTYNRRFRLLNSCALKQGTPDGVHMHYRELLKILLNDRCTFCLLAHNHPEASAVASKTDLETVVMLDQLLEPLGISLLDQYIVGVDGVYSCKTSRFILSR